MDKLDDMAQALMELNHKNNDGSVYSIFIRYDGLYSLEHKNKRLVVGNEREVVAKIKEIIGSL